MRICDGRRLESIGAQKPSQATDGWMVGTRREKKGGVLWEGARDLGRMTSKTESRRGPIQSQPVPMPMPANVAAENPLERGVRPVG